MKSRLPLKATLSRQCRRLLLMAALLPSAVGLMAQIPYTVEFDPSGYTVEEIVGANGETFSAISWPGMLHVNECGQPDLPSRTVCFQVPSLSNNFRITADILGGTVTRQLAYDLIPVQADPMTGGDFIRTDNSAYASCAPVTAEVAGHMFFDPLSHVVSVKVNPFIYHADSRTLEFIPRISLTLTYDECSKSEAGLDESAPMLRDTRMDISGLVVNPDPQGASGLQRTVTLQNPSQYKGVYYIVTLDALRTAFEPLRVWKQQKGNRVEIVTVEQILADSRYAVGSSEKIVDEAAAVRRFLMDEYNSLTTAETTLPQMYILLAGDERDGFPIRRVKHDEKDLEEEAKQNKDSNPQRFYRIDSNLFIPTDNYFGDMTMDWPIEWSEEYGIYTSRVQDTPITLNIPVGRLLCRTREDVENYIDKLIIYEAFPGRGDDGYLDRMYSYFHKDTFDTVSTINDLFSWFPEYEYEKESSYGQFPQPYGSTLIAKMDDYGFQSWATHGQPSSFRLAEGLGGYFTSFISAKKAYTSAENRFTDDTSDKFQHPECRGNLDEIQNEDKPSVIYSIACDVVAFDQYFDGGFKYIIPYNMGASFTNGHKYGGVAFFGNTREGRTGYSPWLQYEFAKSMQSYPAGKAELKSKLDYMGPSRSGNWKALQIFFEHTLIGDPEFRIWTHRPDRQTVSITRSRSPIVRVKAPLSLDPDISVFNGSGECSYMKGSSQFTAVDFRTLCPNPDGGADGLVSVWMAGALPVQKLMVFDAVVSGRKSYILRDVSLGEANANGRYTVSGSLGVRCLDSFRSSAGLLVKNGGTVEIDADGPVAISEDVVENGGNLMITAGSTQLGNGFRVEKGGTLTIKNK